MNSSFIRPLSLLALTLSIFSPTAVFADWQVDQKLGKNTKLEIKKPLRSIHKEKSCSNGKGSCKTDCQTIPCCISSKTITNDDFKFLGKVSKTYTITQPGKYSLGETIDFEPAFAGTTAIRILSDNVNLDFCKNKLRQINNTRGCIAIQIGDPKSSDSYENITISNGTIAQFTTAGVLAEPGSQFLYFYYLDVIDVGGNGGVSVPDLFATPVSGGLIFRGTKEAPVTDIYMSSVRSLFSDSKDQLDVNSCALALSHVGIAYFQNSQFDDTRSARIASGCHFNDLSDVKFRACSFNGTTGGAAAYGIGNNGYYSVGYEEPLPLSARINLINCQAKSITATNHNAFQASGIQTEGTIGTTITNCIVQDVTNQATMRKAINLPESNPLQPTNVNGMNVGHLGSKTLIARCVVNTITTSGGAATGYNVDGSSFECNILDSMALDVLNQNSCAPALATAIGINFALLPTAASPLYQEPPFGTDNTCDSNTVTDVIAPDAAFAPGTGIVVSGQTNAVVNTSKFLTCQRGIEVRTDPGTMPAVITSNSDFFKNIIMGNVNEGILDTVGEDGNNTYVTNVAIFNGVAESGSINYVIPVGNPIRNWMAGAVPDQLTTEGNNASSIDNISRIM